MKSIKKLMKTLILLLMILSTEKINAQENDIKQLMKNQPAPGIGVFMPEWRFRLYVDEADRNKILDQQIEDLEKINRQDRIEIFSTSNLVFFLAGVAGGYLIHRSP